MTLPRLQPRKRLFSRVSNFIRRRSAIDEEAPWRRVSSKRKARAAFKQHRYRRMLPSVLHPYLPHETSHVIEYTTPFRRSLE